MVLRFHGTGIASEVDTLQSVTNRGATTTNDIFLNSLGNTTSFNNARLRLTTTGAIIDRNVADANTVFIMDRVHASATGNIAEFRAASSPKVSVDGNGGIIFNGSGAVVAGNYEMRRDNGATNLLHWNVPAGTAHRWSVNGIDVMDLNSTRLSVYDIANLASAINSRIELLNTGLLLSRNIADANVPVIIQNKHASSTGNILNLANDGGTVAQFNRDGGFQTGARIQTIAGASVPSGSTITLTKGNLFLITGITNIDFITTTGWQAGSVCIVLRFQSSLTVNHNAAAPPANTASILLAGAANFAATANDNLTLYYDGTNFVESARTAI